MLDFQQTARRLAHSVFRILRTLYRVAYKPLDHDPTTTDPSSCRHLAFHATVKSRPSHRHQGPISPRHQSKSPSLLNILSLSVV